MHQRLPAAAQVNRRSDRRRELGELAREEHRAQLERLEHARAIRLHEHVVGEIVDLVEVHRPARHRRAVALTRECPELFEHASGCDVRHRGPVQRRAREPASGGDPVEVALEQGRRCKARRAPEHAGRAAVAPRELVDGLHSDGGHVLLRACRTLEPAIARVAAEELVRALPTERDGHARTRERRQRTERQERAVGERLVDAREQCRRLLGHVVERQRDLVVVSADALGDPARLEGLVDRADVVADRERLQALGGRLCCSDRNQRGIDTARQEHAHGHVRDHARCNRIIEQSLGFRGHQLERLARVIAASRRREPRALADASRAHVPHEQ